MALAVLTQNVPFKGLNTVSPERVMPEGFAPGLTNVWFEDGITLRRRPGQVVAHSAAATATGKIDHIFEHKTLAGVSTIFNHTSDGNINHYSGSAWVVDDSSFTHRIRSAYLSGTTVVGDGVNPAKKFNGTAWSAITTTPTPVGSSYIGNIFHVHRGRMYAAGDPNQQMTVYYSDTFLGKGADYWSQNADSTGAKGGFIDISADLTAADEVVGLTTHQDFLVVLCKNHILFYNCDDPNTSVTLHKVVSGEGCITHDSIHGIGEDTVFLSPNGFKSLQISLIQGDSSVNDVSQPIHNAVKALLRDTSVIQSDIRGTYSPTYGLYIATFGSVQYAYQPQFNAWFEWTGVLGTVFTDAAGNMYSADTYLHNLTIDAFYDAIDGGAQSAINMIWRPRPHQSPNAGDRPRWNWVDLQYQTSQSSDAITLKTWNDFDESHQTNNTIHLTPETLLDSGLYQDDVRIPIVGRAEFLSCEISNNSKNDFRFILVEAYYNDAGLRK